MRILLASVTNKDATILRPHMESVKALRLPPRTTLDLAYIYDGSDAEARDELPPVALARAASRYGRAFAAARAVVIGDTPADIRCARAAGTRVVAVATGRHGVEELAAHRPDAVLPDLASVDRVVRIFADA